MADPITAAVIAGIVALLVAIISNFGAESFKRHRDASALAGGLAGELAAYLPAFPLIRSRWGLLRMHAMETKQRLVLPQFPIPSNPVYDSCVARLGSLGPKLAEDVAFVYSNILAFRQMMAFVAAEETSVEQQIGGIFAALESLERANERAPTLVAELRQLARSEWLSIDAR
jgi:hypothetical protein